MRPQELRRSLSAMVYHSLWDLQQGGRALWTQHGRSAHLKHDWNVDIHSRSFGLAILENGMSSILAQEHSTTARPSLATISLSAGLMTVVAFGLQPCV